jgi:hypothetical protein
MILVLVWVRSFLAMRLSSICKTNKIFLCFFFSVSRWLFKIGFASISKFHKESSLFSVADDANSFIPSPKDLELPEADMKRGRL